MCCTASLLLSCSNQTDIQRRYVDMRDECRSAAEGWAHRNLQSKQYEEKDVNAQLATLFSDCMFTKGWMVATPPREQTPDSEIEARQRAESSQVPKSDGIGLSPSLEPGKDMPDFRKLRYR